MKKGPGHRGQYQPWAGFYKARLVKYERVGEPEKKPIFIITLWFSVSRLGLRFLPWFMLNGGLLPVRCTMKSTFSQVAFGLRACLGHKKELQQENWLKIKAIACTKLEETGHDVKGSLLNACKCCLYPASFCLHGIPLSTHLSLVTQHVPCLYWWF